MKRKMKKRLFLASIMLFYTAISFGQQRTVTGTVIDQDGSPIANASFVIKGTQTGGVTDDGGNFSVSVSDANAILVFTEVNHQTVEQRVGNESNLMVIMNSKEGSLEEVVVTALGVKRAPKELGYAMSTIQSDQLTKTGSPNFAGALYGKAPGVRVTAAPGGATSGININIRGTNSITGNSQPLVIIDGVPMRQTSFNNSDYWGDQRARGNGLEDLNPEDIESITILKGASAAALYGSEAMNGVVLVTTKSGKGQGFGLDFNGIYTHDEIAYLPRFQDVRGPGYSKVVSDAGQADDMFFYYDPSMAINGVNRGVVGTTLNFGPEFDGQPTIAWDGQVRPYVAQKAYSKFFNNPNSTSFNLALSNTTENSNTRFSLTREDNEMTSIGSYNKRNVANLNSTFKFGKRFTTNVVVNFINQLTHNRPFLTDRLINNFTGMIPTWDNPEWYYEKYQTSLGYKYVTGSDQSLTPEENLVYNGVLKDVLDYAWNIKAVNNKERSNRLIGSFTNTWQVTDDLSLRARFSADVTNMKTDNNNPNTIPLEFGNSGSYSLTNLNANVYYTDLLANYSKKITEDLKAGIMVGYTATQNQATTMQSYTVTGLSVRNWYDINASVDQAKTTNTKLYSLRDGVFGTVNFNVKDYWYIEGTLRRERISEMHPDNNVLYYPSVNSSLILSDAFNLPSVFNYAKLRGSWGRVGNFPGIYQSALSYSQATLGNQGSGTAVLYTNIPTSSFGNEKIKPETKQEYEFGLETRFLNSRFGVDITYYNGKIIDQILNYSLPISMGSSSILANVGTLRNKGWEFAINGNILRQRDFNWDATLNFSTNKNVVEALPGGATQLLHRDYDGSAAQLVSVVGQPMGDIMVHPIATDGHGNKIVQSNGLYLLDADSWVKGGNAMPKAVGGLINTIVYKNFSLDALVDFRYGGSAMPTGINWMVSRGLLKESLNAMDEAHGGISYYVNDEGQGVAYNGTSGPGGETVYHDGMLMDGVLANGDKNNNVISQAVYYNETYNWGGPQYGNSNYSLYVKKNNYVKMRELSIGYRLPSRIAERLRAKSLQLSVFGRNLFFIYRSLKDLDPEQLTGGSNWIDNVSNAGTSPATRTYGVMLRASF